MIDATLASQLVRQPEMSVRRCVKLEHWLTTAAAKLTPSRNALSLFHQDFQCLAAADIQSVNIAEAALKRESGPAKLELRRSAAVARLEGGAPADVVR